eukprot:TRINITY_DN2925_c0_g2_i4.p1 TRINITY_DN2925_c0_g2~~TRINITY_DN2925_c0_g2_i4.p1  ORF type:complete len:113 (-),score=31.31 TRINITY_DN2925_c0_g2_i4:1607-1945(-)
MSHTDRTVSRVNARMIREDEMMGLQVRFVGIVKQRKPGAVVLGSSDGEDVEVKTTNPSSYQDQDIVEVVGTVNTDLSIKEDMPHTSFSQGFDLANYEKLLALSTKYKSLFFA